MKNENETFKEMLLEKLKNNFTEMEMNQLLIAWSKEKDNLLVALNKRKQDAV